MQLTDWDVAIRLLVALVGAAVIGWERETKKRPAGLRTHMLVSMGSCLFTALALDIYYSAGEAFGSVDPLKVIGGIVGGVGFLGAGAIIQGSGQIHGLTTAAGIWVVAAIGVAAGCGRFGVVAVSVGFAFLTLFVLGKLELQGEDSPTSAEAVNASE